MGVEGGRFESAVERHEGGEAGSSAGANPLTPEPRNYPPQRVITVRPGEDFSVAFDLDPERVKALGLHTLSEEEVDDIVRLEVEGTSVTGEISVVTLEAGIGGDEQSVVVPGEDGEFVPLYLLDVYLKDLSERDGEDGVRFSIIFPSGRSLSARMSFSGVMDGLMEAMLDHWLVPGKDTPLHPGLSAGDLPKIRYRLELPQEAPPTP